MRHFFINILLLIPVVGVAQSIQDFSAMMKGKAEVSPMSSFYLTPQRIVWKSADSLVTGAEELLKKGNGQSMGDKRPVCRLLSKDGKFGALIIDFGQEIQGGVQITTLQSNNVTRRVRLRFGESVSETCAEALNIGIGKDGSVNHHGMRDFDLTLPGLGMQQVGATGFRFLRIDLLEPNTQLVIKEVRAVAAIRNLKYLGSFTSSDERLNKIWQAGAYTTQLCMQDYMMDGIKRDRSVWSGDMHPQMMTINSVFGYNDIVPKSLDFLRDRSPVPRYINGIASYSMWWVIMQYDWYRYQGKLDYLRQQKRYLIGTLNQLISQVGNNGVENLDTKGMRFLDWPSYHDKAAVHAGLQAMMVITLQKGAELCQIMGDMENAKRYLNIAEKMRSEIPNAGNSKEAAALLSLAGMTDAKQADKAVIDVGGIKNFSAFFGYYMLQAPARAGNFAGALNNIRQFWGKMIDLGATTFWEEFEPELAENAGRIDEFIPEGKKDYHKDTGMECYIGLRRSLCHGWSSGPTPWLTEHVLGIKVLEPGCKKIKIEPNLGDLKWVEGSFPTPMGILYVKHTVLANGKLASTVKAPHGVQIIK